MERKLFKYNYGDSCWDEERRLDPLQPDCIRSLGRYFKSHDMRLFCLLTPLWMEKLSSLSSSSVQSSRITCTQVSSFKEQNFWSITLCRNMFHEGSLEQPLYGASAAWDLSHSLREFVSRSPCNSTLSSGFHSLRTWASFA